MQAAPFPHIFIRKMLFLHKPNALLLPFPLTHKHTRTHIHAHTHQHFGVCEHLCSHRKSFSTMVVGRCQCRLNLFVLELLSSLKSFGFFTTVSWDNNSCVHIHLRDTYHHPPSPRHRCYRHFHLGIQGTTKLFSLFFLEKKPYMYG